MIYFNLIKNLFFNVHNKVLYIIYIIIEQKLGLAGLRFSKPQWVKDVITILSTLQTDSVMLIFEDQRARDSEGWMFRDRGAETAKTTRSQYSVQFWTLIWQSVI